MRLTPSLTTRPIGTTSRLALVVACLALAGCANLQRHQPVAESTSDDDAYCRRNGVAQGSDAYVECRKDRDHQRGRADNRMERQHRNMGERMLNGQ